MGATAARSVSWLLIGNAVLFRDFADDPAQGGIVDAADLREEVVLDLVVQAADVPGQEPVRRREIGGRFHLVHHPRAAHGALAVRHRMVGLLDDVRELEHHSQDGSGGQVHHEEADHELPPRDVLTRSGITML